MRQGKDVINKNISHDCLWNIAIEGSPTLLVARLLSETGR